MRKKIYVTRGYPGSGKSTLAAKLVAESHGNLREINRDDIRKGISLTYKYSKSNEEKVRKIRDEIAEEALKAGHDIISSDTNLSKRTFAYWVKLAEQYDAELIVIDFTDPNSDYYVTIQKCIERDLKRVDSVGKDVILRMWYDRNPAAKNQINWQQNSKISAFIIDLDGTLAHHENLRGPFEENYEIDKIDKQLLAIVHALKLTNHRILIVSGRQGSTKAQNQTVNWLNKHNVPYDSLFMREVYDLRKDYVVKKEIYERDIEPIYNVVACFDDRKSVCRMWEELGIKVFRCGPEYDFDISK